MLILTLDHVLARPFALRAGVPLHRELDSGPGRGKTFIFIFFIADILISILSSNTQSSLAVDVCRSRVSDTPRIRLALGTALSM